MTTRRGAARPLLRPRVRRPHAEPRRVFRTVDIRQQRLGPTDLRRLAPMREDDLSPASRAGPGERRKQRPRIQGRRRLHLAIQREDQRLRSPAKPLGQLCYHGRGHERHVPQQHDRRGAIAGDVLDAGLHGAVHSRAIRRVDDRLHRQPAERGRDPLRLVPQHDDDRREPRLDGLARRAANQRLGIESQQQLVGPEPGRGARGEHHARDAACPLGCHALDTSPSRRSRNRRSGACRASASARSYEARASASRPSRRSKSARAEWAR